MLKQMQLIEEHNTICMVGVGSVGHLCFDISIFAGRRYSSEIGGPFGGVLTVRILDARGIKPSKKVLNFA